MAGGETAVIELARASGLALVPEDRRTPDLPRTGSTYGTGQLIHEALSAANATLPT